MRLGATEGLFGPFLLGRVSSGTKIHARVDVNVKGRGPPSFTQKRPVLRVPQPIDDNPWGLFHVHRQLVLQLPLAEAAVVASSPNACSVSLLTEVPRARSACAMISLNLQ